jgi:hypothetical protein
MTVLAGLGTARAEVGDSNGPFGLGASLRILSGATYSYQLSLPPGLRPELVPEVSAWLPERSDGMTQGLARLTAAGRPRPWLSYEAHVLQTVKISTATAEGLGLVQPSASGDRDRAVAGEWHWGEGRYVDARLQVDRLSTKVALPKTYITLGRQAITFGKTYFWNPLDVFRPFGPVQFDRDYKPGVDALRIDRSFGDLAGCTLVGVLGDARGLSWFSSAVLGRAFGSWRDWDFTLQAGKIHGGYHFGGGGQGEVGPLEVRAEVSYFQPRHDGPAYELEVPAALSAVIGVGYSSDKLQVHAEYLYNGAGQMPIAQAWPLVREGVLPHASRQVVGSMLTYKVTPLLKPSLGMLVSLSDASLLILPGLVYSAADEVELLAGAILAVGKHPTIELDAQGTPGVHYRSEFGTYPHVFYLEVKVYF